MQISYQVNRLVRKQEGIFSVLACQGRSVSVIVAVGYFVHAQIKRYVLLYSVRPERGNVTAELFAFILVYVLLFVCSVVSVTVRLALCKKVIHCGNRNSRVIRHKRLLELVIRSGVTRSYHTETVFAFDFCKDSAVLKGIRNVTVRKVVRVKIHKVSCNIVFVIVADRRVRFGIACFGVPELYFAVIAAVLFYVIPVLVYNPGNVPRLTAAETVWVQRDCVRVLIKSRVHCLSVIIPRICRGNIAKRHYSDLYVRVNLLNRVNRDLCRLCIAVAAHRNVY